MTSRERERCSIPRSLPRRERGTAACRIVVRKECGVLRRDVRLAMVALFVPRTTPCLCDLRLGHHGVLHNWTDDDGQVNNVIVTGSDEDGF